MKLLGFNFTQGAAWIVAVLLFVAHQLAERYFHIHNTLMNNYLDAFLFPIIVIPLILAETRVRLKDDFYKFPLVAVLGIIGALAVTSEIIFPLLSERFIADKNDVFLIITGGLIYFVLFNLPAKMNKIV